VLHLLFGPQKETAFHLKICFPEKMEKYRLVAFIQPTLKGSRTRCAFISEQNHEDYVVRLCKIETGEMIDHVETVPAFLYGSQDEAIEYWRKLNQAVIEPLIHAEDLKPKVELV